MSNLLMMQVFMVIMDLILILTRMMSKLRLVVRGCKGNNNNNNNHNHMLMVDVEVAEVVLYLLAVDLSLLVHAV